jgi:hypothetical protein
MTIALRRLRVRWIFTAMRFAGSLAAVSATNAQEGVSREQLILDAGNADSAELFHFGERPRPMGAELYLSKPGRYTFALVDEAENPIAPATPFVVEGPRTRINFELPARKRCVLRIR